MTEGWGKQFLATLVVRPMKVMVEVAVVVNSNWYRDKI
jgi:hypothetical protein